MSIQLHYWRHGSQRSNLYPSVTEAIAAALSWKHAETWKHTESRWGIAYKVTRDDVNLFPEMEEPEQWAAAWDRWALAGMAAGKPEKEGEVGAEGV